MTQTPANWYPDPDGGGGLRYWDGAEWTEQRAPGAPTAAPAPKKKGRGCLTAVAVVVGLFVVLGIIVAIAGGSSSDKPKADTAGGVSKGLTAGGSTDPIHEVTITSCKKDPTLGFIDVKGTAVNDTSKRSDFAIDLAITSADGKTQLGTTIALAQNVEPGQRAVWDAPSTVDFQPGAVCKVSTVQRTASL